MTSIDITTAATLAKPIPACGSSGRKAKAQTTNGPATIPAPDKPTSKQSLHISKSAIGVKLLSRTKGATVEEMMAETGWQPHSVRAYLSGLRKKGHALVREQRKGGAHAYRIGGAATDAASAVQVTEATANSAPAEATASLSA